MRIKAVGSDAELHAHSILRRALADSGWTFGANVSVQQTLDKDGEWLSDAEFDLYTRGAFDVVVVDDAPEVRFALEIDGFGHDQEPQVGRDLIKNDLCRRAGLPLLRIGSKHLAEIEEISVLEWLVHAYVSSEEADLSGVGEEEDDNGAGDMTHQEGDAVSSESSLESALGEPGIEIDHPFPDNALLMRRLRDRYGIGAGHVGGDIVLVPEDVPYLLDLQGWGKMSQREGSVGAYMVSERRFAVAAVANPRQPILEGTGRAEFAWANKLPAADPANPRLAPIDFPWDAFGVAVELAEFHALRQVEAWARTVLVTR